MTIVLITGATGLLGKALLESAPSGASMAPCCFRTLPPGQQGEFHLMDVRDCEMVERVFAAIKPEVVIHTAGIGDVDYAERNREESWLVNVGGTRNIVEMCKRYDAKLVFISSNAVFDGSQPPYSEEDPTNPINYYGQLKEEAEQATLKSGLACTIVRPILMYGWPHPSRRGNLATWVVDSLEHGKAIKVVDDVYSKPLLAENCAAACWEAVGKGHTGVFHVAGRDRVTLYNFAVSVARVFALDSELITPVPSSYFPQIAPRPVDTSYVTRKMEEVLRIQPIGIEEGLKYMRDHRPQPKA